MSKNKVIIIGGGVIGLTTAWQLLSRGYSVNVIESREDVACESSFANGAMHHTSSPEPWNTPGVYRHIFSSLFNPYSAMKLRWAAIPSLLGWGTKFLQNSNSVRHRFATDQNYKLCAWSTAETLKLKEKLNLEYCSNSIGTMKIFRDEKAIPATLRFAEILKEQGLRFEVLDPTQAADKEPQLIHIKNRFAGALFFPDDESGDPYLFCRELAKHIIQNGGEISFQTQVLRILAKNGRVTGIESNKGVFDADSVVLAAGNNSPELASQTGVSLTMAPVKGYSATIDASQLIDRPLIPVIDETMHAAVTPLGDRLRVVGTAEFAGFDKRIRPERIDNLFQLLKGLYPHIYQQIDLNTATTWAAFRPMSADGLPFIGRSGLDGFYINTGHGHIGWTQAVGSSILLADCLEGIQSKIDITAYNPNR